MVKTKLGPILHCNRAHILCRHFWPKNDRSKQSKNSSSCCNIDWACFAVRTLAMAIDAIAFYRDLIRGQFHPEYCLLLQKENDSKDKETSVLKNLDNSRNHLHFLTSCLRWDCPPASQLHTSWGHKKDKKLLKCDCLVFIAAGMGDTGAVFPSWTSQEFGASNWNAKDHGVASMTKS